MKKLLLIIGAALALAACGKGGIDTKSDKYYVMTQGASVTGKTAALSGKVGPDISRSSVTKVGFYWTNGADVPEDGSANFIEANFIDDTKEFSVMLILTEAGKLHRYKAFVEADGNQYYGKQKSFETDPVKLTGIALNKSTLVLDIGGQEQLSVSFTPSDATNKKVTWSVNPTGVVSISDEGLVKALAKGSATVTATADDGGIKATCPVTVRGTVPTGAVDMGTSVYWATENLYDPNSSAATKYYFAWGETASKSSYTKENYVFYSNGSVDYTKGLSNGKLALKYDAANKIKGGNWRIPTEAEFQELKDACTVEEKYKNRRYITVFTSKSTGKVIEMYRDIGCYVGSDNVETTIYNLNYLRADLGTDGKPDTFSGGNPQYYGFRIWPVCD